VGGDNLPRGFESLPLRFALSWHPAAHDGRLRANARILLGALS
jgi:hypothetical protein